MYRLALIALALLGLAAPAQAAEIRLGVSPSNGVKLGGAHKFSGTLTENGAPLGNQVVTLEARRFPYSAEFVALQQATTGQGGEFVFHEELDRNHEIRVTGAGAASAVRAAFVFPRFRLSFKALDGGRVRLRQRYWTPGDVRLRARTHFYLGRRGAPRAPLRARARTRRVRRGRFIATAVVRVPADFGGRFRYASCIPGDPAAGMGDPAQTCGRRFRF